MLGHFQSVERRPRQRKDERICDLDGLQRLVVRIHGDHKLAPRLAHNSLFARRLHNLHQLSFVIGYHVLGDHRGIIADRLILHVLREKIEGDDPRNHNNKGNQQLHECREDDPFLSLR